MNIYHLISVVIGKVLVHKLLCQILEGKGYGAAVLMDLS